MYGLTDRFVQVCYLTTLSVSGLYSFDGRMINEYEAVGRIGTERGNRTIRGKPTPVPLCSP
jgi:hypothetical protein